MIVNLILHSLRSAFSSHLTNPSPFSRAGRRRRRRRRQPATERMVGLDPWIGWDDIMGFAEGHGRIFIIGLLVIT